MHDKFEMYEGLAKDLTQSDDKELRNAREFDTDLMMKLWIILIGFRHECQ